MGEITTKKCTKCLIVKHFDEFSAQKAGKYGKQSYCKVCDSKRGKKYRDENKWKIQKYRQGKPEIGRRNQRKRRALKRFLPHAPLTPAQYERLYDFRNQVFGG